jgi:prepilin-type N-terminal cleavage/methylation domain-containing protein
MKLTLHLSSSRLPIRSAAIRAFTLVEMMTTLAIFSLVVTAMVSLQIFGFKMNSFTSNKLKSTSDSLDTLGQIRDEILEATNSVLIGNYNVSNTTFTAVANGQPEVGNALLVSNSPTNLVTFYLNTNTGKLYELGNMTNNQSTLLTLSSSIVNLQPFLAMDCFGNTLSAGSSTHYTIRTTLLFSNLVYAVPTNVYDTFRVESSATPRALLSND